jgi:ABC-type dipeptide/oligopeptide/nickel transport system permease component
MQLRVNRVGLARLAAVRIVLMPVALAVVVVLNFLLLSLMPGDPARIIAGENAAPEFVETIRSELGLDKPLTTRIADYMLGLIRGDLGESLFSGRSVSDSIREFLPATLELVVFSLTLGTVAGVIMGSIAAYWRNRWPETISRTGTTILQSIPDFFLALILIYLGYSVWQVAPAPVGRAGLNPISVPGVTGILTLDSILAGNWAALREALWHLMLPVLALGLPSSAYIARVTRVTLSNSLSSAQVDFGRARGLSELVVLRYAFSTARGPIITYLAILLGATIGGATIVETIFGWRGLGQWGLNAIMARDIPSVQGFILVTGGATLVSYLALDLVVAVLDPRVSYNQARRQ